MMQKNSPTTSAGNTNIAPPRASRRRFMGGIAVSSAAFMVVPSRVLGLGDSKPPSERLNIAGIGVAGQGRQDITQFKDENIVALCDVDWAHAAGTFKEFPKAKRYKDFRQMLDEQKEIDAVVVATPDHMHAFASMRAIKMGKHVYCEKPLTHSVWEARKLAEAAKEHRVATQMGNQGQASEETRRLCEMIWDDAIGPVREVHLWTDRPSRGLNEEYWPQGVDRPKDTPAVPDTLDWDLWLGPTPHRPYHPIYAPFRWRGWWDFGTGALGDIGCHSFDGIFRALKLGAPISVEATSTRVNRETYPLASIVTYEFGGRAIINDPYRFTKAIEMPPVKLVWYDGGMRPPRPAELEDGMELGPNGRLVVGDKGKIVTRGMRHVLIPEKRQKEYGDPPKKLDRSVGHYKEWAEACKGGKPAGSNFDWAGPLTEAVLLGNVALRLQMREELTKKKLLWDPERFRFTNSDTANSFFRRQYREGWTL